MTNLPALVIAALLALGGATLGEDIQLRAVMNDAGRPIAVELIGLSRSELDALARLPEDDAGRHLLRVHVLDGRPSLEVPPVAGHCDVVENAVRFTPTFSFSPGTAYVVNAKDPWGHRPSGSSMLTLVVPPLPRAAPTKVTAIYPSANVLPENQLRFYIHFSAPMAAGEAYRHIKLLKADGTEVKRAFLEIGEELWDGAGQRLTLLFDPGRVKQGLKPREEFGPVLIAGQSYRLVIDREWRDANNQPLAAGFEKRFTAGLMVDTAVDAKKWRIEPPAALSRDPLTVTFDRPLDRALLMRMIAVADSRGKAIAGEISLGQAERQWRFTPEQPWQAGAHALLVDPALEDSAGNNLERPFEVDVFERVDDAARPPAVRIPFRVFGREGPKIK